MRHTLTEVYAYVEGLAGVNRRSAGTIHDITRRNRLRVVDVWICEHFENGLFIVFVYLPLQLASALVLQDLVIEDLLKQLRQVVVLTVGLLLQVTGYLTGYLEILLICYAHLNSSF